MHYALLIYESPADFAERNDPEKKQAYWESWPPYSRALKDAGVYVTGTGLQSPETATTLRQKDGQKLMHDGPYAETKEQLGGLIIINVPDLDSALDLGGPLPTLPGLGDGSAPRSPRIL